MEDLILAQKAKLRRRIAAKIHHCTIEELVLIGDFLSVKVGSELRWHLQENSEKEQETVNNI